MKIDLNRDLDQIDLWIRSGNSVQARKQLLEIHRQPRLLRTHRGHLGRIASLFRRVGLQSYSIRILRPLLRGEGKKVPTATPAEAAEYGVALVQIGALQEGERILRGIPDEVWPHVRLFRAFARIQQWDYGGAIPLLRSFMSVRDITDYEIRIAKANLLSALVHEESRDAVPLGKELLKTTREDKNWLLHGVVLQLLAESAIYSGDWGHAEECLQRAERTLSQVVSPDLFFVEKWKAILRLRRDGARKGSMRDLRSLRERAAERKDWETVRDCDFHACVVTKNLDLFRHLHFGTPFTHYRERLFKQTGLSMESGCAFEWSPGLHTFWDDVPGPAQDAILELQPVSPVLRGLDCKVGQVSHRLLSALCSDFYKPLWTASLFDLVFPDQYYNPSSGPLLVRQSVFRLNQALHRSDYGLNIASERGFYSVQRTDGTRIRVKVSDPAAGDRDSHYLEVALSRIGDPECFAATDLRRILDLSERSVQYWITRAIERRWIEKSGAGPKTRYRIVRRSNA